MKFLSTINWQHFVFITVALLAAEAALVGWGNSSAKLLLTRSASTKRDLFWWLLKTTRLSEAILLVTTVGVFHYAHLLYSPKLLEGVHPVVYTAAAFVIGDFVAYWLHRMMHAVPFLWEAHKVHHSATDLNLLLTHRFHPLEDTVMIAWATFFFTMIGASTTTFIAFLLLDEVLGQIQHARLRWDYGPLRGVIVSPTFHRLHHSILPADHNRNFGGRLAIWDRLFGTYSPKDIAFDAIGVGEPPRPIMTEVAHPYMEIARSLYRRAAQAAPSRLR